MTTADGEVRPLQLDDYQRAALLNYYAPFVSGRASTRLDERALWREQVAAALFLSPLTPASTREPFGE